jgi:hypothetical protein
MLKYEEIFKLKNYNVMCSVNWLNEESHIRCNWKSLYENIKALNYFAKFMVCSINLYYINRKSQILLEWSNILCKISTSYENICFAATISRNGSQSHKKGRNIIQFLHFLNMFNKITAQHQVPYFPVDKAPRCITRIPNFFYIPFDV